MVNNSNRGDIMKLQDLTGQKFGRLTVIERDTTSKTTKWICKCDCGNTKSVAAGHLKSGSTTSCGCYQKEKASISNKKHGHTRTSLHNRWKAIKQRCLNPNNPRYSDYGKRGITLCEEWYSYENFEKWSLENGYEEGLSLDRIDNEKGYEPSNCRWSNDIVQNRNKRNVVWISNGKSKIRLREVSEITGIAYGTLYDRYSKSNKTADVKDIISKDEYMLISSQS